MSLFNIQPKEDVVPLREILDVVEDLHGSDTAVETAHHYGLVRIKPEGLEVTINGEDLVDLLAEDPPRAAEGLASILTQGDLAFSTLTFNGLFRTSFEEAAQHAAARIEGGAEALEVYRDWYETLTEIHRAGRERKKRLGFLRGLLKGRQSGGEGGSL